MASRQARWAAAMRARWRAHSCCPRCGLPTEKYVYCLTHRAQQAKRALAWWRKQREAA